MSTGKIPISANDATMLVVVKANRQAFPMMAAMSRFTGILMRLSRAHRPRMSAVLRSKMVKTHNKSNGRADWDEGDGSWKRTTMLLATAYRSTPRETHSLCGSIMRTRGLPSS